MKIATFIKNLEGFTGAAKLYKLSEPLSYNEINTYGGVTELQVDYVVVHRITSKGETVSFVMPSSAIGYLVAWADLKPEATSNDLSFEKLVKSIGYTVGEANSKK